jgi:hypothetical protein
MKEFNAEEMAEFGRAADFSPLVEETEKRLGVKVGFETIKIAEPRRDCDRVRVVLESEDIAPHCGIFVKILRWVKISSFGGGVYQDRKPANWRYRWSSLWNTSTLKAARTA